ncbi:BolA family protein [Ferrimonas aestuarii]|uniref:BolA family transcriptional regulator n=1 Tax=Ferrimonas aestuarii TaxID=2569539 RepID=A0A4U1BPS1_9GAMM|nr:BolA family protein [Ferrimonas aestuarii]TKB55957.1 BolA family transcriptional regulator [Ferrimonas aestuarii]
MQNNEVADLLKQAMTLDEVKVTSEGTHYKVIAVGECFEGQSRVKRQQAIYGPLMPHITDGTLHALTIKAFTPEEWRREKMFNL